MNYLYLFSAHVLIFYTTIYSSVSSRRNIYIYTVTVIRFNSQHSLDHFSEICLYFDNDLWNKFI